MTGLHELADLAPRDVVAKAIMRRMRETGARARVARRPPLRRPRSGSTASRRSSRACRVARHRPGHRPDPGRAGLPLRLRRGRHRPRRAYDGPGLFAAGRWPAPACTAPTGSRRTRCSRAWCSRAGSPRRCADGLPARARAGRRPPHAGAGRGRRYAPTLQRVMTERAGVLRSADGLVQGAARAGARSAPSRTASPDVAAWETTNLHDRRLGAGRGGPAARGDPRVALARGLPRPRRRALGRATSTSRSATAPRRPVPPRPTTGST